MTVYARSDLAGVSISRDHGGCGEFHGRPVVNGAPVQVWALECHNGCENVLRGDPLWASELATIPETPDETQVRKTQEMLGQRDAAQSTAQALQKLSTLGDLPTAIQHLTHVMSGNAAAVQAPAVTNTIDCPNGHAVGVSSKFCPECGSPMVADPVPAPEPKPDPEPEVAPEVPVSTDPEPVVESQATEAHADDAQGGGGEADDDNVDLDEMTVADLNQYARDRGIKVARTKAAQIDLINEYLANQ